MAACQGELAGSSRSRPKLSMPSTPPRESSRPRWPAATRLRRATRDKLATVKCGTTLLDGQALVVDACDDKVRTAMAAPRSNATV